MAHKDMYYQAGKLSTCGSALRKNFRPTITATVIPTSVTVACITREKMSAPVASVPNR